MKDQSVGITWPRETEDYVFVEGLLAADTLTATQLADLLERLDAKDIIIVKKKGK